MAGRTPAGVETPACKGAGTTVRGVRSDHAGDLSRLALKAASVAAGQGVFGPVPLVTEQRHVATNVFDTGLSTLNTSAATCRSVHTAAVDCYDRVLGFGNFAMLGAPPIETDGVNTYTVRRRSS